MGSKKKISKQIVAIIKQNFGIEKTIYDVFGGGGAITAECLLNGLDVRYNDLDTTITACFEKVVSSDREYLKTLLCSRDEFIAIKNKTNRNVDDELKLLVNSFGNNRLNYLYNKEQADLKYNLALEILAEQDSFSGYHKTEAYKKQVESLKDKTRLQQLQNIEQLQHLQQLERLEQLESLKTANVDYKAFSAVEDAIFYLDPPYEGGTNGYRGAFDSQQFYDWAFEMSKRNIVLLSSYEVSDPRFEVAFVFENARSTLQSGTSKNHDKVERLFMVREQLRMFEQEQLTLF